MLFVLQEVWKEYPAEGGRVNTILRGASVCLPEGGITCLVGPSGSGKSTVLRLLNRLEDPGRGRILFRGQDLAVTDPAGLRRQVGLVFQSPVMLPGTVRHNLEAGVRLRGLGLPDPADRLEMVGLPGRLLDQDARELSGGEKQRVALARTLAVGPEVLLLDEITASLDNEAAAGVERLIRGLGLAVVWVSHDPAQVRRVADRVFRLEKGLLAEQGAIR